MQKKLLNIKNLHTYFFTHAGVAKAVQGVNLELDSGEMVGVVGESGCGKSVMARSILRLIRDPGKIIDGSIFFMGKNLLDLSEKNMQKIRGNEIFNDLSRTYDFPQSSTHNRKSAFGSCEVTPEDNE